MTQENLQDALGLIDDDMIAAADELRQKREENEAQILPFRKKFFRREFIKWGSLAASLCLLVGISFWSGMGAASSDSAAEADDHLYSQQENMEAVIENDSNQTPPHAFADTTIPETETTTETSAATSATGTLIPPSLEILCGSTSILAASGNYEWSQDNNDITNFVIACGMHPLDCEDTLVRLYTTQAMAQLQFISAPGDPTDISVRCWNEAHWGDSSAESQPVTVTDGQIPLKSGGYIYEITAKWDRGTVCYAFYAYYEKDNLESYTGTVSQCSAVLQDPGNYVLKLDTEKGTISFTIVETTQLIGIDRADQLQLGDAVSLTCFCESEQENSYRCVITLEIIP